MNLNKQQLNAVALDLFNKLEIAKNAEMERITPALLKDKKLVAIKKIQDQLDEFNRQSELLRTKRSVLIKDLDITGYTPTYKSIEKEFLDKHKRTMSPYSLDDIKNLIVLASIEETDLSALMDAVIKKINE